MDKTPVFIGVGGTGQTVLAAYLRLANMAGFVPAPFYVVDSDTNGPLGSILTALKGGVKEVVGGQELAPRWMMDPFPTANVERKTFGGLFGNLTGERRELFNCLFSAEAEQTRIRTGMYGRPSIGATCIRHKILAEDDELKELKAALRGGAKHVILVGSCFGGTGSGGVPMLAAELNRWNNEGPYNLTLDAFVFLPWFHLVKPEGGIAAKDEDIHEHLNKNFGPNAAAGINYFKDVLTGHVHTLFLLGVPDPGQVRRVSSESSQQETAHSLNLLAAVLIHNRFTGELSLPRGVAGYWLDPQDALHPRTLSVRRGRNGDSFSLMAMVHRAYLRQEWLGILSRFFHRYPQLPRSHRPIFVRTALRTLEGTTSNEDQTVGAVAAHLERQKKPAQDTVAWIQSLKDSTFFPLNDGEEKIQSGVYDSLIRDPLKAVSSWCDDAKVVAQFQKEDFRTPEIFADKFADRFLANLTKQLQL